MVESFPRHPFRGKIALIGNYVPRQCGIATFTTDLLTALTLEQSDLECSAVVMNDRPEGYNYPPEVRFEIDQRNLSDFRLAADFLNMNRFDVVCLQHEFGIFGGQHGSHILELMSRLRMSQVTTFHTVLDKPESAHSTIVKRIAQLSDRIVVMSEKATHFLQDIYGLAPEKIEVIPHGIPDVPFVDPYYYKEQFGLEERRVILTFGLLSPNKGIETMIDALPEVVKNYPDVVYVVLGATHPHIKKTMGEAYRFSLQQQARRLGVDENIIFHNRYVSLKELLEFIGAADIYVTPYLNREQITSGTLAYALGCGKAVISTPYWHAEELLADGRGRLVPFKDPAALASEINELFENDVERNAMRKRAYLYCRGMIWKEVARRYLELFNEVKEGRELRPRKVYRARFLDASPRDIPTPNLEHIIRLTDDVGILQHAKYIVPDRDHGYCTDDNARALIATLMARELFGNNDEINKLMCVYAGFLHYAFNHETGRFRNFMSYDRKWREETGSADSHGRAVWALGEAIALDEEGYIRGASLLIFPKAITALPEFDAPRSWAFGIAGMQAYLKRFGGDSEVRRLRNKLAETLFELYMKNASDDWPWIENILTYANGKICQALIASGRTMEREDMVSAGIRSLEWLVDIQTDEKGYFVPIGNKGWYPRGGARARFDQQPIEALNMIESCREAYETTGDNKWLDHAQRCLEWYFGRNDLNAPLYDHKTGGCCDGLHADGPNRNQGAESTLACFLSLANLNQLRSYQISTAEVTETTSKSIGKVRSDG